MMSQPFEMDTAEYECLLSPPAEETGRPKPETASVRADFGAVSHTGKVRLKNEDHFLVFRLCRRQETLLTNIPDDQMSQPGGEIGYSMIVADGMGGMAAGEVASRLAITTALKLVNKSAKWGFKINQKEARSSSTASATISARSTRRSPRQARPIPGTSAWAPR